MVVPLIPLAVRRVDRHVGRDAVPLHKLAREGARDPRPLLRADLRRQRQLPFARRDGVPPRLARLGRVPQRGAVPRPVGRIVRRDDERLLDAGLAGVVVDPPLALACDARARPVGGGRRGGAPGGPFDRLDGEVVARHAPYPPASDGRRRASAHACERHGARLRKVIHILPPPTGPGRLWVTFRGPPSADRPSARRDGATGGGRSNRQGWSERVWERRCRLPCRCAWHRRGWPSAGAEPRGDRAQISEPQVESLHKCALVLFQSCGSAPSLGVPDHASSIACSAPWSIFPPGFTFAGRFTPIAPQGIHVPGKGR